MTAEPHRRRPRVLDVETEHTLKNHLAIIVGYCELLLAETPPDDPRHVDMVEMHRAATAVLAMFPQNAESNGNKTAAAQRLGVSRRTLHRNLAEFRS